MTNLYGSFDKLIDDKTDKVRERFKMGATFHPLFAKIEEFLPKAKKINPVSIGVLLYYLIRHK